MIAYAKLLRAWEPALFRVHEFVRCGRADFILAEIIARKPYITCQARHIRDGAVCFPHGCERHGEYSAANTAYHHLMERAKLHEAKADRYIGYLDIENCVQDSFQKDYTGKIIIISPHVLKSARLRIEYQLHIAVSGKGCLPGGWSFPVRCHNLRYGYESVWERQDILGIVKPDALPD